MAAAASGMHVEEVQLDSIAGDLAGADVIGFKKTLVLCRAISDGASGIGAGVASTETEMSQGKLVKSGGAFDLAIDGPGFFRMQRADGNFVFTRNGQFSRAPDGRVVDASNNALVGVTLPAEAVSVAVTGDGRVTATTASGETKDAGRIALAWFSAPELTRPLGDGTFVATPQSGKPFSLRHLGDRSTIRFGMLERSNVSVVESMMEILTAQRAFEADSKGVQAADEMHRIANNISRG